MNPVNSPYVKIYHLAVELSLSVTSFEYEYEEEKNDEAKITIQSEFPEIADLPALQEGAKLEIIWGNLGESTYTRRIVFVSEVDLNFNQQGVKINIKATDKAAQIKFVNDKYLPTETDLVGLQVKVGELFGLNIPLESNDETYSNLLASDAKSFGISLDGQEVQANRNWFAFLQDIANRADNGPVIVEGRDEDLRIFKRNLNQRPIKSYTYKGDDGLLEFNFHTKNKAKQGDSSNIRVDSWNPENKTMSSSDVNYSADDETQLGEVVDKTQRWLGSASTADSTKISNNKFVEILKIDKYNLDYGQDPDYLDARVVSAFKGNDKLPGYFDQGAYIVPRDNTANPLSGFAMAFPVDASKFNLSQEHNHESAIKETLNQKKKGSLEKNEATATFHGENDLVCGKIITILGVSKKYSGNYYIKSSKHTLKPKQGWMVECKLLRNALGRNNVENPSKGSIHETDMTPNQQIAVQAYKTTFAIPEEQETLAQIPRKELKYEEAKIDNTAVIPSPESLPGAYKIINNEVINP